jgi:hypothetical protein
VLPLVLDGRGFPVVEGVSIDTTAAEDGQETTKQRHAKRVPRRMAGDV